MGRGEHVGRGSMGRGSIGRGSMGSIGRVSIRRERACTGGRGGEGAWKEARGEGACGEGERWERERGERGSNMLSACEPRCGDSECLQFAPWPCELLQPATHSHAGVLTPSRPRRSNGHLGRVSLSQPNHPHDDRRLGSSLSPQAQLLGPDTHYTPPPSDGRIHDLQRRPAHPHAAAFVSTINSGAGAGASTGQQRTQRAGPPGNCGGETGWCNLSRVL